MKAKIRRYLEMSIPHFRECFPDYWSQTSPSFRQELLSKEEYIVRIIPELGLVEFGFPSDSEWKIK